MPGRVLGGKIQLLALGVVHGEKDGRALAEGVVISGDIFVLLPEPQEAIEWLLANLDRLNQRAGCAPWR